MDASRLLLVEDDAVSAAFLSEALSTLPARVDVAGDIAAAVRLVEAREHDLWIVDAHLPDGDGLQCLRALRECRQVPALAITAGAPREELDALCAGGFLEVMLKPVSMALLLGTVRRVLGLAQAQPPLPAPGGKLPVWDEQRALAAIGGNPDALAALRRLFLEELPRLQAQLAAAQSRGDVAAIGGILHKLRASCGFVGAARLAQAVEALARTPLDAARLAAFGFAADDALAAGTAQR